MPSGDARAAGQPRGRPRRGGPGCPRALPRALPRRARGRGRRDRRRGRGGGEVTSRRRRRGSREASSAGIAAPETRIGASTFPRSRPTTSAITLVASENLFPSGRRSACAAAGARSAWWTTRTRRATRRADGRPSPQTPWRKTPRGRRARALVPPRRPNQARARNRRYRNRRAKATRVAISRVPRRGARRRRSALFPRRVLDADAEVRRGRKRRGDRAQPDRAQPARDGPREPTETARRASSFCIGDASAATTCLARRAHPDLVARRRPDLLSIPDRAGRSLRGHDGLRLVLGVLAEIIQRGFVRVAGRLQRAVRKEHAPLGRVRRRALRLGLGDRVRGRSAVRTDAGARGLTRASRAPGDPAWFLPRAESMSIAAIARGTPFDPLDADDGSALTDRRACVVPHTFSRVSARTF